MWKYDDSEYESKCENQINMIPLIDIMLVLLVIFMIAMPIISEAVVKNMQVQQHSASIEENVKDKISVTICNTSELSLDGRSLSLYEFSDEMKNLSKDSSIELMICGETSFDTISQILNVISTSEHRNISFVRYQK